MSRARGPRVKIMRALGTDLPGLSSKKIERRPYPPGQHGQARKKVSDYGLRLQEKQKARMNYGLTERQLRRLVSEAKRSKEPTGEKLLELLERRLDNVVFRAGFARTIPAARQLVCHGHVLVDGKRVDIASFRMSRGQTVSLRERSHDLSSVVHALHAPETFLTPWLEVDKATRVATVMALPDASSILFPLRTQLLVEHYTKSL